MPSWNILDRIVILCTTEILLVPFSIDLVVPTYIPTLEIQIKNSKTDLVVPL